MDTLQFNETNRELTIYQKPPKNMPLSFAGKKIKLCDVNNILYYRTNKRLYLYLAFAMYCAQILLSFLDIFHVFTSPIVLDMALYATTLILFILYFAMPGFNVAIFESSCLLANVLDVNKAQLYDANKIASNINKTHDTTSSGMIVQAKKVTLAERGASIMICGKCSVKTSRIFDIATINAQITPTTSTVITVKKRFNPLPIIFILAGIGLLVLVGLCIRFFGKIDSAPPDFLAGVLLTAIALTLYLFFYGLFAVILIAVGISFIGRVHTTVVKIQLSDNFILRCRLHARDFHSINALINNVRSNDLSTSGAGKEEITTDDDFGSNTYDN